MSLNLSRCWPGLVLLQCTHEAQKHSFSLSERLLYESKKKQHNNKVFTDCEKRYLAEQWKQHIKSLAAYSLRYLHYAVPPSIWLATNLFSFLPIPWSLTGRKDGSNQELPKEQMRTGTGGKCCGSECFECTQDKLKWVARLYFWASLLFSSVSAPTSATFYETIKMRKGDFMTPSTFNVGFHYLPLDML